MPELSVSLVVVHYRTPHLLEPCLASIRRSVADAGIARAKILVVDNDPQGTAVQSVGGAPDVELLVPGLNLGYAGAFNHALLGLGDCERVVLMNPDVLLAPTALSRLLATLDAGYGVAGPRLFWDRDQTILLPPADRQTLLDELVRAAAGRTSRLAAHARRRWRRHALRHWQARGTLATYALSGAVLAFRREVLEAEAVGAFDSAFPLYYEETDWLMRARRRGVRAALACSASAIHHYDQSGAREGRAAAWLAASRRRFLRNRYGPLATLIHLLEPSPRAKQLATVPSSMPPETATEGSYWLEISPTPLGFPAGGSFQPAKLVGSWALPADIRDNHPGRRFWLRAVDERGRESRPWLLQT